MPHSSMIQLLLNFNIKYINGLAPTNVIGSKYLNLHQIIVASQIICYKYDTSSNMSEHALVKIVYEIGWKSKRPWWPTLAKKNWSNIYSQRLNPNVPIEKKKGKVSYIRPQQAPLFRAHLQCENILQYQSDGMQQ